MKSCKGWYLKKIFTYTLLIERSFVCVQNKKSCLAPHLKELNFLKQNDIPTKKKRNTVMFSPLKCVFKIKIGLHCIICLNPIAHLSVERFEFKEDNLYSFCIILLEIQILLTHLKTNMKVSINQIRF